MERKNSDVYVGTAVVAAALGVIALLFKATIVFRIIAVAAWVWVACRFWQTNVGFLMLLGGCMFPPLIFLLFVKPQPTATHADNPDE